MWDTMVTTTHDEHEGLSDGAAEIGQSAPIHAPQSIVLIVGRRDHRVPSGHATTTAHRTEGRGHGQSDNRFDDA